MEERGEGEREGGAKSGVEWIGRGKRGEGRGRGRQGDRRSRRKRGKRGLILNGRKVR